MSPLIALNYIICNVVPQITWKQTMHQF